MALKHFSYQVGSLLSRALNVLLGGSAHMTASARAYDAGTDSKGWNRFEKLIDFIFSGKEPNHCERVWDGRVARAHETIKRDEEIRAKRN